MAQTEPMVRPTATEGEWIPTLCDMCYGQCGILVRRVRGLPVEIKGNPDHPSNEGKICAKGIAGCISWHNPYRVKSPLRRGNPEKGIGVDPRWVEIGWDEALNMVAEKLKKVRQDDPRKLLVWYWDGHNRFMYPAFAHAFGSPNVNNGPSHIHCGPTTYTAALLYHGAAREAADLRFCNYLLVVGSQIGAGIGKRAVPGIQGIAEAKARGMKLVVVDPRCSDVGAIADEWIPIRPGTDAAFALTLVNLLVNHLRVYDATFLKQYSNGPYLVGPDQLYVRDKDTGKPLVWDSREGAPRAFDAADPQDCALEGTFDVEGVRCRTAFQLLKEHVARYTPEMVSKITTVPAETLRRVAREIGEAAQVGSVITLQGKRLPLRPFAVIEHMGANAHAHSMLLGLSLKLLSTVLGALDVPGGVLAMPSTPPDALRANEDGLVRLRRVAPGSLVVGVDLRKPRPPETTALTELYPYRFGTNALEPLVICDPERYKLPYAPEMLIQCRTNFMIGAGSPSEVAEAVKKIPFMVSITNELDETAEFADIVFPDLHYLECLDFFPDDGMQSVGEGHYWYSLVQPVVAPPFEAPFKIHSAASILMELAYRAGFLPDVYKLLNLSLQLKDQHRLDPSQRYDIEQLSDRRIRSMLGDGYSLEWFRKHGVAKVEKTVEQAYHRQFHAARVPLYLEEFLRAKEEIDKVCQGLGIEFNTSDYQPLPEWKPCPAYAEASPDYDLFAVIFKVATHTFGITASNPWLIELAELRRKYDVWINPDTASRREIQDGDAVLLESEHGVMLRGRAKLTEAIHPEVVGIPGTFGQWAKGRPLARGRGVASSSLLVRKRDRIDFITGALDHCVKLRVTKA